jgi:hydroxymethylglutaryl-CoA lyase
MEHDPLRKRQHGSPLALRAILVDVSARDGLQSLPRVLPAVNRASWVRRILETGVGGAEAGSMVSASRVPQMADTDKMPPLLQGCLDRVWVLVPNARGLERASKAGFQNIVCVISATEAHSRANLGRSMAESLAELGRMGQLAAAQNLRARVAVSVAWGDVSETGAATAGKTASLAAEARRMGFAEITLCDTAGMAGPKDVTALIDAVAGMYPPEAVGLHLHDSRGLGKANVAAALERGVLRFDASVGGIGGCPFLPGAPGNLDMEELARFLMDQGVSTGVDLERLALARRACMADLGDAAGPAT